jgi:hypothetical protein
VEAGLRGFQLPDRNSKNGVIDQGFIGGKMIGFDEYKRGEKMKKPVMMKCGCLANAKTDEGKPCCAVHAGIIAEAYIIDNNPPDLSQRKSQCYCCK